MGCYDTYCFPCLAANPPSGARRTIPAPRAVFLVHVWLITQLYREAHNMGLTISPGQNDSFKDGIGPTAV